MDPLPRLGARRTLAGNRFFDLVEEEIEDRSGRMYPYFTVASKWDAVVAVPLLPDGRLVVERIYRHPYRAWLHEFPAGGIEPGEDPVQAAGRELAEETGYTAGRLTPLHAFEAMPGLLRMRLHLVLAEDLHGGGERRLEAAEFIQVEHLTVEQTWELARRETASSFLTLGLLALARLNRS
jgi:8-oxo-dGTP pyrophosphatase MutT (NUDIX family)